MESQQDEDTSHPNSPTTQPKGKKNVRKRGPTYMISFQQKIDSGRLPPPTTHFDEYGRPTGEEVSTFESFLGMLAKTRVEITLRNWKDYAEPRRELLWQHILKKFNVVDPKNKARKTTLKDISDKARKVRADLVRVYLNPLSEKYGKFPGDDYKEITLQIWDEFIRLHQTKEFQALREKNKQNASKHKHPQRAGRGGYRLVKQKIKKEKLAQMQLDLNDPECAISPPSPPRHEIWIRARQDEKGAYLSGETAKIATMISQYEEEYTRGEFVVEGRADILAAALPNPEHPGRVRGEQGKVGWKDYFTRTKSSDAAFSKKEIEGLTKKLKQMEAEREIEREKYKSDFESVRAEMRAELKARDDVLMKLLGQMNGTLQKDDQHVQTSVDNIHMPISKSTIQLENMPPVLLSPHKKMKLAQIDDKVESQASEPMLMRNQSFTIQREKIHPKKATEDLPAFNVAFNVGFENIPPLGVRCKLYLNLPTLRLVARANVFGQGVLLHGKPLNEAQARVCVQEVILGEENTMVPYVTDEVQTLSSSIGTYIAWPKNLIEIEEPSERLLSLQKKMKASKPKAEKIYQKNASQIYPRKIGNQRIKASKPKKETVKATSDISFLPCTWDEHMKTTFQKMVTTQKEPMVHVTSDIMRHEFYFFISIDDLKDFMKMKAFNISILQYWIWVLYDRFELCDKKTYRFLDPAEISSKPHNGKSIVEINNNRIRYVENSIKDDSVECWLAPYNAGSDWMLCAIVPNQALVFCFDLVQDVDVRRKADMKHIINSAFLNLKYQGKAHYVQRGKVHPKWINVKCYVQAKQVEGAYFVMRMMYDIIVRPRVPCIDEIYGNEASPFQMKDINEMKSLFCAHFNSKYDELIGYSEEHVVSVFGQVKNNSK
ncbi:unnamed protein product [Cuscuta campestris]|uniref:DUF8039 domain-containing protein n=1 Tax=Cuscuta campestris TaxID=132261 RepID=A0A484LNS3_9ASTE|nr:unnamed protein product [Cuscuta campestris]